MAPPNELSRAITSEEWSRVNDIIKTNPQYVQQWTRREGFFDGKSTADVLPIHEAIVGGAPYNVIIELINIYPNALKERETSYQRLPLHCACRKNAQYDIVQYIIQQYPDACIQADSLDRVPLHYALSNGADLQIVNLLIETRPNACKAQDHKGWSPAHVAANLAVPEEIMKKLLQANPEAVLTKTNRGHSIRSVIPKQTPNRSSLKQTVTEIKDQVEKDVKLPSLSERSLNPDKMTYL